MFFGKLEPKSVWQNLQDAGCDKNIIHCFMECFLHRDKKQQLKILAEHRQRLLHLLHENQQRINCLDYLVYKIRKDEEK